MSAQIVIISGPDKGRTFSLSAGAPLQVGRSQSTATKLSDPSVSRVHCEIEYDGQQAMLVNISSNGTVVNGKAATQQTLRHGDVVRVGGTEFRFQLTNVEEAETVLQPAGTVSGTTPAAKSGLPDQLSKLPGNLLSNYRIDEVIAKGQSGMVFKGTDTRDNQTVAIKVLQPEFSRNDEEMQRFIRAMKTVLPLRHPNIITLLGAGKTGPFCWVAMEYVEGESMTQVIQRMGVAGMLDWRNGFRVAVHIARALEYAHGQSIIHRNVTPTNILWRQEDKTALLGDLILAKALEGTLAQQVTRPGELLGDIAYMAPERTRGTADVDGRADLYGLGATVYALIAGRPPFTAGTLPELINKIRNADPEKPKKYQMSIPDLFQGTVLKLLAKRPEERFQTATDLIRDLERVGKFAGVTV
jgi:serine/threonine protein kinase